MGNGKEKVKKQGRKSKEKQQFKVLNLEHRLIGNANNHN